jgi:hypothetical protein
MVSPHRCPRRYAIFGFFFMGAGGAEAAVSAVVSPSSLASGSRPSTSATSSRRSFSSASRSLFLKTSSCSSMPFLTDCTLSRNREKGFFFAISDMAFGRRCWPQRFTLGRPRSSPPGPRFGSPPGASEVKKSFSAMLLIFL